MLVGGDAEVAERFLVAVLDPGARDHLGTHEPGPEPAPLAPERLHADARHRCQNESGGYLDSADSPMLSEVDLHEVMVDGCRLRPGGDRSYPSRPS